MLRFCISVEYSWRLQWNERLMKDFYLLRLLTSLLTSGISLWCFGGPGMKVKMFNLAVKCIGCGCRCSAVTFVFFWLSQNNETGLKIIKYLFYLSWPDLPRQLKAKQFTTFEYDSNSTRSLSHCKIRTAVQYVVKVSTDTNIMQLHLSMLHL